MHGMAAERKVRVAVRRVVYKPAHPLATKNGYLLESRMLLYDEIGQGPHGCHWCSKEVRWQVLRGQGTTPNGLVADHVDTNWRNNDLSNLVPSCQRCNGMRHKMLTEYDLYIVRTNGRKARAVEKLCERCEDKFLAMAYEVSVGKGRFCSPSCARKSPRPKPQ